MGTNFYTLKGKHIGKRSAAGWYCWDCNITLCKDGNEGVHHGCNHGDSACMCRWHKACPKCGAPIPKENLADGAAGRELGFNKQPYARKVGVASCSSFTWAMERAALARIKFVKDEYGRRFTKFKFLQILEECPIQYTHMIGEDFS